MPEREGSPLTGFLFGRMFAKKYRFSPTDADRLREALRERLAFLELSLAREGVRNPARIRQAARLCAGLLAELSNKKATAALPLVTAEKSEIFLALESYLNNLQAQNGWRESPSLEKEITATAALQGRLRSG